MKKIIELIKGKTRYPVAEADIVSVSADEHYISLLVKGIPTPITLHRGIGAMQIELSDGNLHVRVHESHLANYLEVFSYEKDGFVHFKNSTHKVPLSDKGFLRLEARFAEHNRHLAVLAAQQTLSPSTPPVVRHLPR